MSTHLEVDRQAAHVELRLNRPARRNALCAELIAELTAALRQAGADDAVRSVILTGAPPAFCAGLDLDEVAGGGPEGNNAAMAELCATIEAAPTPVIAAVNGAAVAGGAALVCACDVAICAASATVGYPGVKRGLVAPLVMTYLTRLVGERHARYLILTGQSISAGRAIEIGLVNEVVPDAQLLPRARALAAVFAGHPREALAQTKAHWGRLREARRSDPAELRRLNELLWRNAEVNHKPADVRQP